MMLKNSAFTPSEQSIPSFLPLSCPSLTYHQTPKRNRSEFMKIEAGSVCKRKYIKKSEAGRLPKVTRPCSECGKKFSSWKALFGHMRCHPERQWRGINPPCHVSNDGASCVMNKEDHEVAECLLMLTNGVKEIDCDTSYGVRAQKSDGITGASQKKVKKGESSEGEEQEEIVMMGNGNHECNICLRVFSSGQALGGHKRCHWVKWNEEATNQGSTHLFVGKDHAFCFDLNLPASTQDVEI